MDDNTRQANVVLTADTSNYSQQMMAASTQTNNAADSVNKLINSLDRLQRATSRRLEIFSAATIAGIGAATMAAAKFEQQMSTLQASAAITGKNFGYVSKSVDELRRNLPVSTEQVIQLVTALQKMGASQAGIKTLADTFIRLGAATGEDIGSLATNLVGLQRAMGTTEGATRKFADSTAYLSANLGVSATGLLQFANQLAPVARTVGMTQTQVMGFSAAFLKAGQDGFAASTVFTKLITDISRATRYGSNDIYAYANAVGMTADAFKKLPAADQATAFFSAISRQGADAIKTLERLGYDGPRALKAIQGLAQSGGLGTALSTAQAGFNSNATQMGSAAAMDGLNDSLKKLQNTLTSIAQTFGQTFLRPLTAGVDGVNALAQAVRGVLGPLNSLLGVLGLTGGIASGVLGAGIGGLGMLATVAGAYALMRNPLTAGFQAARASRTGGTPSRFAQNTASNINDASPWQRRMFGMGAGMGNMGREPVYGPQTAGRAAMSDLRNSFRGGLNNIPGRLAMAGSALYQSGLGLARSGIDPIRYQALNDATKRPGFAWGETKEAWRSVGTGDGASVGRALSGAATASVRFSKAVLDATVGVARLGGAAAGVGLRAGARSAGAGIRSIGSAGLGLVGGPIGAALIGGTLLAGYASSVTQQGKDFRDRLADPGAADSAVNKYASNLGLAGSAALSFAQSVQHASTAVDLTMSGRSTTITGSDTQTATGIGHKVNDATIASFKKTDVKKATQYASTVFGMGSTVDPAIQQSMKLDLIDKFGADQAGKIIAGAQKGNIDLGQLVTEENSRNPLDTFRLSGKFKDQLSTVESSYSNLASYTNNQFGQGETAKLTNATVNQLVQKAGNARNDVQRQAIMSTIEQVIGEGNLNLGVSDTAKISNGSSSQQERQQALYNAIFNNVQNGGNGGNWLKAVDNMSPAQQSALTYQMPNANSMPSMYQRLGVYNTAAGGSLMGGIGQTVNQAIASPDDANLQLQAATQWAQSLTTMTGSTTAAGAELQQLKAVIRDTTDPLYQMAAAAQSAAARLQGYQAGYNSSGQNARTTLGNLAVAYQSSGPDSQQNIVNAEDQYEAARSGLFNQFKNIVKSYKEFDVQQGRSIQNYNIQRSRSDQDYNTSRKYAEADYWLSKQRSQEDFDKSRRRSEEDFQHQLVMQIRENARTMTNAYAMITTQPTWDSQNLLTNSNDQLTRMKQQQSDLSTVRGQGLSGDVISQLGLNDFSNQQQLARMVSDLANNPDLVTEWNKAIQGKLDISKAFVTDQNSDSWTEMQRQYKLSLDRMSEDFATQNSRGESDYRKTLDRQNTAYALSMARTGDDFRRQMGQAKDDLNRSFEEITGSFSELSDKALSSLTGTTKAQYQELSSALGMSRDQIKQALSGTSEDLIKALAPLFGGEDAARKALALATAGPKAVSGGNISQQIGGPSGSEHSFDSASAAAGGGMGGQGDFDFPLPAGSWRKTSGFGMRTNPVTGVYKLHAGTDLAARPGTPIGAAEDGQVTKAQVMGGLGNMVEVSHGDGTKTWYGHMSLITAKKGQMVSAGQQIGLVGSTGNTTGPHLHFERHVNGNPVDPWGFLQGLSQGGISGPGNYSGKAMPDVSGFQSVKAVEKGFSTMPEGQAYTPGLFTAALQTHVNGMPNMDGLDGVGGDYMGGMGDAPRTGFGRGYVRSGAVMETHSVTYNQHYDQATNYTGPIVVQAQDPNEMGRKLGDIKRLKALTRPSRSNA